MARKLSKIHRAAANGDLTGIERELAQGIPVDLRDPETGWTPLMQSATAEAASLLIARGADINAVADDAPVLHFAIREGNIEKVRVLLDAGADVQYLRPHGYDALIDAMHNSISEPNLLLLLSLLIDRGASLNCVSRYSESALGIASRTGQFDVIRLLLNSGANPAPLQWTPLMQAIALGSLDDVERELGRGSDRFARDFWSRTPWLLSLQTNDVDKAKRLLEAGADRGDRGRCGKAPLMYPAEKNHFEMLRWLLAEGFPADDIDDFEQTALMVAAERGATECAGLLIDAGADIHARKGLRSTSQPVHVASNLQIVRLLIRKGADLNDINDNMRADLTRLPNDGMFSVPRETYLAQKHRRFGTANPELMNLPFWVSMVKNGEAAYSASRYYGEMEDQRAVWCFKRFGKSITELADGRIIEVAGEHEDSYDPDFCIYNDVVVHHGDGTFDIYGYPKDLFPPTDFHTATLIRKWIYLIGSLGYRGERQYGRIQVFRLDTDTLAIERLDTAGVSPGWINRHKATAIAEDHIRVSGGKVCAWEGTETYTDNSHDYVLDVDNLIWRRS